jgi:altronate dehydratase
VKSVLVISERDNVATALQALEGGRRLEVGGAMVVVQDAVPSGHKIALRAIRAGEAVIKYGSPIGLATADIAAGAHVHTHNLASTRGRGDLELPSAEPQPRLAEPPDERNGAERVENSLELPPGADARGSGRGGGTQR